MFNTLGLHPLLVQAVEKAGYETPTPVQQEAIPAAISGRDLMVSSATGSGKTAAFMLPSLHKLTEASTLPGKGARIVVLTPTRELAMQVTKACELYGRVLPSLKTVSILGGVPYVHQQRLLRQPLDVMVATPGRLIDYIQRGQIDFSRVETLVLDEADRMLDMGFIEDIEHIVSKMPSTRQTLMFSATFGGNVGRVAQEWLNNPLPIKIESPVGEAGHANIEQRLHYTRGYSNKLNVLEFLLKDETVNQAIVFTATQREADTLSDTLADQGFISAALHGGMNQRQRSRTLQQMHMGRVRVLVATDVAARGLDVEGISHVINFDLPKMAEDYVHRIGRTGRAGRQGVALTLADIGERRHVQRIERFTDQRIPVCAIEGLAPIPAESTMRGAGGRDGGERSGRGRPSGGRGAGGGYGGSSDSRRPRSFAGGSDSRPPRDPSSFAGSGEGRRFDHRDRSGAGTGSGAGAGDYAARRPRFSDGAGESSDRRRSSGRSSGAGDFSAGRSSFSDQRDSRGAGAAAGSGWGHSRADRPEGGARQGQSRWEGEGRRYGGSGGISSWSSDGGRRQEGRHSAGAGAGAGASAGARRRRP